MAQHHVFVDGKKVATLRGAKGWTQKELSAATKLSIRKIQELEAGGKHPRNTVAKLAKVFGLDVEAFQQPEFAIAVRQFANFASGETDEYISEGLAAEISSSLTRLDLKVIPPSSLRPLGAKGQDVREIGKVSGVSAVLDGSVHFADDEVRVIVQLLSAADGRHLWSSRYACKMAGVFGVCDQIAQAIVDALELRRMGSGEADRRPKNMLAWNAFRKGCHHFDRLGPRDIERAEAYFKEAIQFDGDYTPAYVQLASCYHSNAVLYLKPARDVMPQAKAAALRAVKLDEREPGAQAALAAIAGPFDYDWREARRRCKLALAGESIATWSRFVCAYLVLIPLLRFDEAIAVLSSALAADPLSFLARLALASAYSALGSFDLAVEELNKLLEFQKDYWPAHWCLGLIYWRKEMPSKAVAAWTKCFELVPWYPPLIGCLAAAHARAGDRRVAENLLSALDAPELAHVGSVGYGWFHVLRSEFDAAADHFERVIEARDPNAVWFSSEPVFEEFRASVRGRTLLKRMNLPTRRPRAMASAAP